MSDGGDAHDSVVTVDDAFDALLKRAAHVSGPAVATLGPALHSGSSLLNDRLRIQRRIGEGGMGTVYAARDEQRRSNVALKTLNRLDAANVYRLKNEFRTLADVSHPNLCRLHELFGDKGQWFFTMELIDGERFDHHVRPTVEGRAAEGHDGERVLDEQRLRAVLPQLIEGIAALHREGKLHRDLKPSNVLVTGEGRVVILDFGLAVDPELGGVGQTVHETTVSGTPGYMAPEQAAGKPATTASDYYALGVMLFEALTGRVPFSGRTADILVAKQHHDAPLVKSLCPSAPADLSALTAKLLSRSPHERPSAQQGLPSTPTTSLPISVAPRTRGAVDGELLVGRDRELAELRSAFDASTTGRSVMVFVAGESGVGKTTLVDALLSQVQGSGEAVVLSGRCYEREAVPYKAFDALIDALSRYLRKLPTEEANALMPRDVFALARLFPVLDRIDAVARAPKREIAEPKEQQQRAFAAFGELLGRIRDRGPLIVHIDDIQWVDQDSSLFMAWLLAHHEPIAALVIGTHRNEGAHDNRLLQDIIANAKKNSLIDTRTVMLEPLSADAAQALAQQLLIGSAQEQAHAIASESHGSPFFIGELVRQARTLGGRQRLSLHEAVLRHVSELGGGARALIEVLAVAGRPLPVQLALDAAATTHEAVDTLLAERLLRTSGSPHDQTIECYHDRIRETVSVALDPAVLRDAHARLAHALSASSDSDPEHLALHWLGASEPQLAATQYHRAADQSFASLAFERAARQYERARALGSHDAADVRTLHLKHARALTAAGRNRGAAEAYQQAASGAVAEQALDHKRNAAHLLLTSGCTDEGRALLREVVDSVGLALPGSRVSAVASAVWSQARLKLRGHSLAARRGEVSRETETRLRVMWTIVQGGLGTDPFLIVDMLARYARLALDEGSAVHAARALGTQAFVIAAASPTTQSQTEPLITEALAFARSVDDPEPLGRVLSLHGSTLYLQGSFVACRRVLNEAIPWLSQRCQAVSFELAAAQFFELTAAHYMGRVAYAATASRSLIDDAVRRGDAYSATLFVAPLLPSLLAHRGLDEARNRLDEVTRLHQPQAEYSVLDLLIFLARMVLSLHEGRPREGAALARQHWPLLKAQTPYLRSAMSQVALQFHRSGCELSAARQDGSPVDLAAVKRAVAQMRSNRMPYAKAFASTIEAGLALHARDPKRAADRLRVAAQHFDARDMQLYAAAARRRLGQLIGGDEGRQLLAAGDALMAAEAVVDVEATTEMHVPGCRS